MQLSAFPGAAGRSSLRNEWTLPRTWFVTARLLEVAALVAVLGLALQNWQVYQSTLGFNDNGQPLTEGPPFLDRVALFAAYGFGFGQTPFASTVACLLVLAVLAVLHFAQPVSHASLLRWEVLAVGGLTLLLNLAFVLATSVALIRGDPNAPESGTVVYGGGPGFTTVILTGATVPVVCLLLLAVAALWWLRLPVEFEVPDEEPAAVAREPRRWRPAPAPDANVDDLALDGVELIEPVERLHPREGGDGSTGSGYDDYFRRF
jgi:hypothetical protein